MLPDDSINRFDHALAIAARTHCGQRDKAGEPYILHPIRVAMRLPPGLLQAVGLLHDTIEDSHPAIHDFIEGDIRLMLGSGIVSLVRGLSRKPDVPYEHYIEELAPDPILRPVKLADIADNLDPERHRRTGFILPDHLYRRYIWAQWYLERAASFDVEQRKDAKPAEKVVVENQSP